MKNNKVYIVAVVLMSLLGACKDARKEEIKQLQTEVIAIHDEVMPKMGELQKLKKSMMILRDSVASIGMADSTRYNDHVAALDTANNLMMNWMREYEIDLSALSPSEAIEYLQDEKTKIGKVRDSMNKAMSEAAQK